MFNRHVLVNSLVALTGLWSFHRTAHADDAQYAERMAVTDALFRFQSAIDHGKKATDGAWGSFEDDPAKCYEAIERGKRVFQPTDMVQGNEGKYLFKRAGAICDEYKIWKPLVDAATAISEAQSSYTTAHAVDPGDVKQEWVAGMREIGEKCLAKVKTLTDAGMSTELVGTFQNQPMTVPAAADKWCGGLVRWSEKFAELTAVEDAKKAAAIEELKSFWRKHKVGGEKLDLFVEYDGYAWLANKGGYCTEVSGAEQAKAKVLFHRLSSDSGWTLRRMQFKGNKVVSIGERHFDTQGQTSKGCK